MDSSRLEMGLLEARALTYKIISTGFIKPPDAQLIKLTCQEKLFESFPLKLNTEGFLYGLDQLKLWCNQINTEQIGEVVAELKNDFNQLFVGPHHLMAPPWESVYLTEEKLTFDRITLNVREFYRRHGLEFTLINREPDDHFAVELEFMEQLINRQIQHIKRNQYEDAFFLIREQEAFLKLHLIKWTPLFTHSVLESAQTDYYQGLARLAHDFIEWDYEHLSKIDVDKPMWLTKESKDEWEVEKC
ncbi:MAG TPA: molecular chaperone TorD family protein [Syntrophomonadaceae bacterium]|nr:molecular chaperone TorD family protein [Syntrophomonadaceae bacterium]